MNDDLKNEAKSEENMEVVPISSAIWVGMVKELELTPQQGKVAWLVVRGMRDKNIATDLDVSVSTVRKYLTRTFRIVGVRNRLELVRNLMVLARQRETLPPVK